MFDIRLHNCISEFTADESFGIEDSVVRVFGSLIFGCVSDESFSFSECDIGWGGSVSLVVSDDLNSVILPHSNTGVGGSEIDSDSFRSVAHLFFN